MCCEVVNSHQEQGNSREPDINVQRTHWEGQQPHLVDRIRKCIKAKMLDAFYSLYLVIIWNSEDDKFG